MRTTLKDKMDDAYDTCIGDLFLVCNSAEHAEYVSYRNQTRHQFREVARLALKAAHMHWVDRMRDRLDEDEEKLLSLDINATTYLETLDEIRAVLDEVEELYDASEFQEGHELTREAHQLYVDALRELREEMQSAHQATVEQRKANIEAAKAAREERLAAARAGPAAGAPTIATGSDGAGAVNASYNSTGAGV